MSAPLFEEPQQVYNTWLLYQDWDELKSEYGLESMEELPLIIHLSHEVRMEQLRLKNKMVFRGANPNAIPTEVRRHLRPIVERLNQEIDKPFPEFVYNYMVKPAKE